MSATPSGRIRANGKQLLLDGRHIADCRDEITALALRDALDFSGVGHGEMPQDATKNVLALLL